MPRHDPAEADHLRRVLERKALLSESTFRVLPYDLGYIIGALLIAMKAEHKQPTPDIAACMSFGLYLSLAMVKYEESDEPPISGDVKDEIGKMLTRNRQLVLDDLIARGAL